MTDDKAIKLIDKIQKDYEKNGATVDGTIPMLKDLRQIALDNEDPLVTRTLRHTYEHIEENNGFDLDFFAETYDEEEDGEEQQEGDSFLYLLDLLRHSENKFNRDEIRNFRELLK